MFALMIRPVHCMLQVLKTTVSLDDPSMPGWSELANDIVVNEKTVCSLWDQASVSCRDGTRPNDHVPVQDTVWQARPTNLLHACQSWRGLLLTSCSSFSKTCVARICIALGTMANPASHLCTHTCMASRVCCFCLPCSLWGQGVGRWMLPWT